MKYCINCGNELDNDSVYCPGCGTHQGTQIPYHITKCINCGKELKEDLPYCPNCGTQQRKQNSKCRFCGRELIQGAPFCPYCGKNQSFSASTSPQKLNEVGNIIKSILPKLIIAVVVIAALIIVIDLAVITNEEAEDLLTNKMWYCEPYINDDDSYDRVRGMTIIFDDDNEAEVRKYVEDDDADWYISSSEKTVDWKILDDKTLIYNDKRYTWQTEWSITSKSLRIETDNATLEFSLEDEWYYDDARD